MHVIKVIIAITRLYHIRPVLTYFQHTLDEQKHFTKWFRRIDCVNVAIIIFYKLVNEWYSRLVIAWNKSGQ